MRRISLIVSLATMLPWLCGCHHGSTTTTTPLSPMGMGQAPVLNPFGTTTRVSPPPTGNHAAPSGYLGSPTPGGVQPPIQTGAPPSSFPIQSNSTLGSTNFATSSNPANVQAGGWTTTQPAMTQPTSAQFATSQSSPGSPSTFGSVAPVSGLSSTASSSVNPSAGLNPRAGGMPVIDLTAAPPPPGYQPTFSPTSNPAAQPVAMAAPTMAAPMSPMTSTPQAGYPTAAPPSYPSTAFPSNNAYPTTTYPAGSPTSPPASFPSSSYPASNFPSSDFQSVSSPAATQPYSGQLTPLPPTNNAVPLASAPLASAPASAPTTSFGASTQEAFAAPSSNPIDSGAADASQLIWRSPGTRY